VHELNPRASRVGAHPIHRFDHQQLCYGRGIDDRDERRVGPIRLWLEAEELPDPKHPQREFVTLHRDAGFVDGSR
jgi:hypothetical protein